MGFEHLFTSIYYWVNNIQGFIFVWKLSLFTQAIHNKKNSSTAFIGDMVVGSRRDDEIKLQGRFSEENPTSEVLTGVAFFGTSEGGKHRRAEKIILLSFIENTDTKHFEFISKLNSLN